MLSEKKKPVVKGYIQYDIFYMKLKNIQDDYHPVLRVTYICIKVLKMHENNNTHSEQCGCLPRERQVGCN